MSPKDDLGKKSKRTDFIAGPILMTQEEYDEIDAELIESRRKLNEEIDRVQSGRPKKENK